MKDRHDSNDVAEPRSFVQYAAKVRKRFEAEWRAGRQPRAEDYLGTIPEPERSKLLRDLLAVEIAHRRRGGDQPRISTFERRLPGDRALIAALFREVETACPGEPPSAADGTGSCITLKVTAGPHEGRLFAFKGHDLFMVGRSKRTHFQLRSSDMYFSRFHFMVEVNPPHCRLMDMNSRNGTYLNGRRVTVADLKHGDQIEAGRTTLQVSVEGGLAALQPPRLPTPPLPEPEMPVQRPSDPHERATVLPRVHTRPPTTVPLPALPAAEPAGQCRVCAALAAARPSPPYPFPLCEGCLEKISSQPQPIAGYLIVRELGHGSMGIVHLAVRISDGTLAALKTITPAVARSQVELERFLREANILCRLQHPHIVPFRDMGENNGQLYFAMDYVRGVDARRLLKKHGPLPIPRAVGLTCQLLTALDYAHQQGFVHRDIKPSNLLVTTERDHEVTKLADFGLAKVYQASKLSGLTVRGDIGGTVAFMAPEQITNFREAKPPVDQYSAAATLYNLLTDQYIYDFPRQAVDQLVLILEDCPILIQNRRPDIPDSLAAIIHRALAKEPDERFADVKEMHRMLAPFCR